MPQFPEIDPETLAQAIRTYLASRMNVNALQNGAAPNSIEVIRGWADAIAAVQNPSNSYFHQNDQTLFSLIQQLGLGSPGNLLFTAGVALQPGQFVYQSANDTVALADFSSASLGPAVGVVVGNPSPTTVLVQNLNSFTYSVSMAFGFLPLTPDTLYYVGSGGGITSSPTAPSGGYNQVVGYAKTTYQLVLNLGEPVLV